MTRDERVVKLGDTGENLIVEYFHGKSCNVIKSSYRFDSEKDMTIDGKTVEIKTLFPIYKYNAFCLPLKQSNKCENVDRLIFVEIPKFKDDGINLYESFKDEDSGRRYDFREYFNGETCQFYRLTNLSKLDTIHDQEKSSLMWDLSPSTYKGISYAA